LKKLRGKWVRNQILKKLFNPVHLFRIIRLSQTKKKRGRSHNDAQLKFYGQVLQGGFLHYAYFDNPKTDPESISLKDFYNAQRRYVEKLIELIPVNEGPILDVGCGLGGLMQMLREGGYEVTGLTPDRFQIEFIRKSFPDYTLIHSKFENFEYNTYKDQFNTVINSESLQYIKLDKGLPVLDTILKPNGRWIISDYFRTGQAHEKSGHQWDQFVELMDRNNLKITYQEDITENIRPTLAFLHLWGSRFGLSLYEFLTGKIEQKNPGLNYLMTDIFKETRLYIDDHLKLIDPDQFASDKKYMILMVERKS